MIRGALLATGELIILAAFVAFLGFCAAVLSGVL